MAKDASPGAARRIPDATIRRLPAYLRALEAEAGQRLTSAALGVLTGFSSEQVRKDLAYFGAFGTRGVGYPAQELASEIRHILGLDRELKAALFGAGHLGTALARYVAATHRDVRIVAIFDPDPEKVGGEIAGTAISSLANLEAEVRRLGVAVAILAVPESAAQALAGRLAAAGIRGFLNFAPVMLSLPVAGDGGPPITIHNIDLSIELQTLAYFVQVHETAHV